MAQVSRGAATLDSLPPDLLIEVLLRLNTCDRVRLSSVNAALWRQGRDPAVWATLRTHLLARTRDLDGAKFESLLRFAEARGKGSQDCSAHTPVCNSPGKDVLACQLPQRLPCERCKAPSYAGGGIACLHYGLGGAWDQEAAASGGRAAGSTARLLRLLPALKALELSLDSFDQLGRGVLAVCSPSLTSFCLSMDGCEEYLMREGDEPALAWLAPELARLPALESVTLDWWEARWTWGFWRHITALCKATALTSLCLLNSEFDCFECRHWDPAVNQGQWGPELAQLQSLRQYKDNLGLGLPRQVAALTRLTSLTLLSFTWARQGPGLSAARHLSQVFLRNCFAPEVDDAREVSHSAVQEALHSVTHLQWEVEPWAGTAQPYLLPNLVTLVTRWPGEQLVGRTTWLPACNLQHLVILDPFTLHHLSLRRISDLTTLRYLHVRCCPDNGLRVRLASGPWLARIRVVKLQGVSMKCVPPELCTAPCLEVLDLRGNKGLQLDGSEVSCLLDLQRLRLVWLCKTFAFVCHDDSDNPLMSDDSDSGQVALCIGRDRVNAVGRCGGACTWSEASLSHMARLRSQSCPPLYTTTNKDYDLQACSGCGGPFQL